MIVGDPSKIAIESLITYPYDRPSQRALGFFVIHVGGKRFGICSPEATLLACSFDTVKQRIEQAGKHTLFFLQGVEGARIVDAVIASMYDLSRQNEEFFGFSCQEFRDFLRKKDIIWAPDGDRAFDDGSHVLQFDNGENVRVIGFKNSDDIDEVSQSISDVTILASEFYAILSKWHDAFEVEWAEAIKFATRH
jgi:hypothetical protein